MRTSTRNKRLSQCQRFLGGQGTARAYGVGEIGPDPRRTLFLIFCGVVAIAVLSFVIYSVIVVPGVFLIWAVYVAVERSSSVVVTDDGVAILARSEFNGRPRKFVALLPPGILIEPVQRSRGYVHLPTYGLWLRRKEYDYLASAMPTLQPSGQAARQPANFGSPISGGVAPAGVVRPQRTQGLYAPSKRSDYPPLPNRNPEPGWQTIGNRFNDQWYWNGQEWTGHRRWVARQWVEDPPIQ
jgi:hypothetical protein